MENEKSFLIDIESYSTKNQNYNINLSKKRLSKDLSALFDLYSMSNKDFIAGKVVPPIEMARQYNKLICRMHTILEDLTHANTFPILKKQVSKVLSKPTSKEVKFFKTSNNETTQILNKILTSLRKNCEETFLEFKHRLEKTDITIAAVNEASYSEDENSMLCEQNMIHASLSNTNNNLGILN